MRFTDLKMYINRENNIVFNQDEGIGDTYVVITAEMVPEMIKSLRTLMKESLILREEEE